MEEAGGLVFDEDPDFFADFDPLGGVDPGIQGMTAAVQAAIGPHLGAETELQKALRRIEDLEKEIKELKEQKSAPRTIHLIANPLAQAQAAAAGSESGAPPAAGQSSETVARLQQRLEQVFRAGEERVADYRRALVLFLGWNLFIRDITDERGRPTRVYQFTQQISGVRIVLRRIGNEVTIHEPPRSKFSPEMLALFDQGRFAEFFTEMKRRELAKHLTTT